MALAPLPEPITEVAPPSRKGITRRQALAAAVATGVGVGAVRLLGGAMQNITRSKTSGGLYGVPPVTGKEAKILHLFGGRSSGYTPAKREAALSDGYGKRVDRLLETKPVEPPVLAAASTPGGRFGVAELQQWWIDHMLTTTTPFAERMTLFWHGHFTSDYRKTGNNTFMYWQNLTWRRMALTNLRPMLLEVTTDPAMLRYLDLATSTGQSPNENYSRELMELFTMGAGNYTEDDVRQSAKALAGWQQPPPDSIATVTVDKAKMVTQKLPVYSTQKPGVFNPKRAYKGTVTFLGKSGSLDTQGVIDRILAQPATAPFIASKVVEHFGTTRPVKSYITRLGDAFRQSKYDVKTLMRAVLTSPEFTADASYRALLKSPTEFMVNGARALGATNLGKLIVAAGSGMGQSLFDPPDVGGWPNNAAGISSNTVVERVNFVTVALAQSKASLPSSRDAAQQHLDGVLSPQTAKLLTQAPDERSRWFVTLASPEFQLK